MSTKRKAIITLILIVPLLTELLSGNTPITKIVNPVIFGYFIVMYGFPVLLIREAAVGWKLGVLGLLTLGLAYGILNEGVAARTLLLSDEHMFMASLRGYSTFGINFLWASAILPWHALFSIIYPIIFIRALYPQIAEERLLSKRAIIIMSLVVSALASLSYFSTDPYPSTSVLYLPLFWGVIVALIILAKNLNKTPALLTSTISPKQSRLGFVFGLMCIMLFITPLALPATHLPALIQFFGTCVLILFFFRYAQKHSLFENSTLVRIAFGNYLIASVIAVFALGTLGLMGEVIVWGILFSLWIKVCKVEKVESIRMQEVGVDFLQK